jgi:hypothetical protein
MLRLSTVLSHPLAALAVEFCQLLSTLLATAILFYSDAYSPSWEICLHVWKSCIPCYAMAMWSFHLNFSSCSCVDSEFLGRKWEWSQMLPLIERQGGSIGESNIIFVTVYLFDTNYILLWNWTGSPLVNGSQGSWSNILKKVKVPQLGQQGGEGGVKL